MLHTRPPSVPASTDDHLIVACPNAGGLLALGPEGSAILDFDDTVGLFAAPGVFARAFQTADGAVIDLFLDGKECRRLRLPEVRDMHDVFVDGDRILSVSTGDNAVCIHTLDGTPLERIALHPVAGDCWHANCLGKLDGRLVLSAFGQFDEHRGWSGGRSRGRGFVATLGESADQVVEFSFDHASTAFLKAYRKRPLRAVRDMVATLLRS